MALAAGTRLGPFEVVAPLGAGGMGEVYRAKDTKLGREVALKTLPETLAHDGERLARVVREAKTLAALNHPHIAQIHGLDESTGTPVLVMELVEGPTLADRLAEGPMPRDEALPIARQIAEALEAAHDLGIVHRDLKPANIKVRSDGTVKVLDFGLAKPVEGPSTALASETLAHSPTITSPAMTLQGVILGTAAYMSPEQAKGKPVDRRADIWAFGCVLYEMLAGRRAFEGEDVSDTLAAVLRGDVTWTALPAATPAPVKTLLARCLERDVRKRLPHIGVARLELANSEDATQGVAVPPADRRPSWFVHAAWATAAAILVTSLAVLSRNATAPVDSRPIRFEIAPPPGFVMPGASGVPRFALSPDGTKIVFAASQLGESDQFFVRDLDSLEARPIEGTKTESRGGDGIQQPFWSPDGQFIAYFGGAESALKRVEVGGGVPQTLASVPAANPGGSWSGETILVASMGTKGVHRLSASGGAPQPVTTLDVSRGEQAHLWPQFLPDGEHFLYLAWIPGRETATYVGSLSGAEDPVKLVDSPAMTRFAPPNRLLFVRDQVLVSQTLDVDRWTLTGRPEPVSDAVMVAANTRSGVSTSNNGVVAIAEAPRETTPYVVSWRDRTGRVESVEGDAIGTTTPWIRLSADGTRLAFVRSANLLDVWVRDTARRIDSRVTANRGSDTEPVWSPDGRNVAYRSNRGLGGLTSVYYRDATGVGEETPLVEGGPGHLLAPEDWSLDGRYLLYRDGTRASQNELWGIDLTDGRTPFPFIRDEFSSRQGAFSPDGRWVAYVSDETGRNELFVRSFPDSSARKVQVTSTGGLFPRWRRDGKELFYIDSQRRLVSVPVTYRSGGLTFGGATPLFGPVSSVDLLGGLGTAAPYDVAADGKRFVVVTPRGDTARVGITVAVNWMSGLGK